MSAKRINRFTYLGQIFYSLALFVFGLQHLIYHDFVTRLVPFYPAGWGATRSGAAYLIGLGLMGMGGALLLRLQVRTVALVLAVMLFFSFVVLHLPLALTGPAWSGLWTNAGKCLAMCGGALVILGIGSSGGNDSDRLSASSRWQSLMLLLGRSFLGLFLILCGIQHFLWVNYVTPLVPRWVPGPSEYWVLFSGAALLAGGIGFVLPKTTRLAATMTSGMIFVWVLVLHLPRALRDLSNANETTAFFEALAFTGIALLIAAGTGSRKTPASLSARPRRASV